MKLNLAECFFDKAEQQPERPLIMGPGEEDEISYGELSQEVRSLASRLQDAGVERGDNIGLHYRSGREYIVFVYALWACGACVTPLPLELTAPETRQIFQHIAMDGVIAGAKFLAQIGAPIQPASSALARQAAFAKVDAPIAAPPELAAVNAAFIRFTSGTTGDAKGVVLSHESILERIQAANRVLEIGKHDRILWLLSMDYHFAVSIVALPNVRCWHHLAEKTASG